MEETTFLSLGIFTSTILGVLGAYIGTKYKPNSMSMTTNLILGAVGAILGNVILAVLGVSPPILNLILSLAWGFIFPLIVSNFKK